MCKGTQGAAGSECEPRVITNALFLRKALPLRAFSFAREFRSFTHLQSSAARLPAAPPLQAWQSSESSRRCSAVGCTNSQPGPESPAAGDDGAQAERVAAAGQAQAEHNLGARSQLAGQRHSGAAARQVHRPSVDDDGSPPAFQLPRQQARAQVERAAGPHPAAP
jgi:hypothetical protein